MTALSSVIRWRSGLTLAWAVFGCGGSTDRSSAESAEAQAVTTACDAYFDAQYSRCAGPAPPADESSRIRSRFQQVCKNQIGLPGSGVTVASLTSCASALAASGC